MFSVVKASSSVPLFDPNFLPPIEQHSKFLLTFATLHELQLSFSLNLLSQELGHWVKPRNIAWFSRFLLTEFDEERWLENFCMNKNDFVQYCRLPMTHYSKARHQLPQGHTFRNSCIVLSIRWFKVPISLFMAHSLI
jgi:hypothetical protein